MLSFAKVAPSFNFWFRCLIWETSKALIWLKSQKTFDVIIRISVSIAMRQRPNVFQWFILQVFLFIVKYIWKNTHTQLQSAMLCFLISQLSKSFLSNCSLFFTLPWYHAVWKICENLSPQNLFYFFILENKSTKHIIIISFFEYFRNEFRHHLI